MLKRLTVTLLLILVLMAAGVAACEEVYFSPNGGVRDVIRRELYRAEHTVDVAVYSFTDPTLAWTLVDLYEKGVRVRIYLDKTQAKGRGSREVVLRDNGLAVALDSRSGAMHHKFVVIDGQVVVTGSYNWSAAAEDSNQEDLVIIRCPELAAEYARRFEGYWAKP